MPFFFFFFKICFRSSSGSIGSIFFPGQRPLGSFPLRLLFLHHHPCCSPSTYLLAKGHMPGAGGVLGGRPARFQRCQEGALGQQRELSARLGAASEFAAWIHSLSPFKPLEAIFRRLKLEIPAGLCASNGTCNATSEAYMGCFSREPSTQSFAGRDNACHCPVC